MSSIPDPASSFGNDDSKNASEGRDSATGRFLTGNRSSPGRKGGTRVKLSQKFFEALSADFEEHGVAAIARVRFMRPDVYFSVVAKLMPQKIEITNPVDEISDELLAIMLEQAEARLAALKAGQVIEGNMRNVTPTLPPLADAPPSSAELRAETVRRDMHDQHDALAAVEPVIPAPPTALPCPVGCAVPVSARDEERRNVAKLHDDTDVDPASLF